LPLLAIIRYRGKYIFAGYNLSTSPMMLAVCNGHNEVLFFLPSLEDGNKSSFRNVVFFRSRESAVGIATGYGLDGRRVRVRVPVGIRFLSLYVVQIGSVPHPVLYAKGTVGSFPGGIVVGVLT
jgi:hypothetical protein